MIRFLVFIAVVDSSLAPRTSWTRTLFAKGSTCREVPLKRRPGSCSTTAADSGEATFVTSSAVRTELLMTDTLSLRLKTLIIATLKLDDVTPADIPDDEPLIGSTRFGLDSIDALELVLAIEKEYGVKIGSSEESRQALGSVNTLAAYLRAHGNVQ
jgi:acyl carrier protein